MSLLLRYPKDMVIEGEYIILKPNISEKEFWEISDEDSNFELINGVLVIHSPASEEHEDIFRYLTTFLGFFLDETSKGRIYGSRFVMRLGEEWNPEPDLMIITPEKYSNIKETRFEGPADIVIEILSKATREIDLTKKLPKYLESGVKEVWIIDPENKILTMHSQQGIHSFTDSLSQEKIKSGVLGEIPIQINWIWDRKNNPVNKIIKEFIKGILK